MGYVSWLGRYDEEESVMTTLLRKAGAVYEIFHYKVPLGVVS
jgi:amidase